MFRTSYSFVAVSRKSLPAPVKSLLWFTQYAPHAGVYTPIYVGASVPRPFSIGSLYKFDHSCMFWRFATVRWSR